MDAGNVEAVRAAAFAYLQDLIDRLGFVSRAQIQSFSFEGSRIPLAAPQRGIHKPRGWTTALSMLTTFTPPTERPPYEDGIGPDDYLRYKWRGTDPRAYDNVALRAAMEQQKPLIWFYGLAPGVYDAVLPVWLVAEEPAKHQFVVALDDVTRDQWSRELAVVSPFDPVRRYAERIRRERLHQRVFRDQVLLAYRSQCALCRLRHVALLDAAHIKEDSEGGRPVVPNGVSMCAIHHRAFDAHVLGVRPDYRVQIRSDVLQEVDGPTLQHALQGLHGELLLLPRRRAERPSRELLEERYERFRAVG